MRHYEKVHIPARQWFVGQFIRWLTIVGLPGGIRGLFNSGNQDFADEEPLEGYRRLVDSGRVVQVFVVLNSEELDGNPKACAPALVIGSLAGTDDGDAIARELFIEISTRIHLGKLTGPADKAVQAMISDSEYRCFLNGCCRRLSPLAEQPISSTSRSTTSFSAAKVFSKRRIFISWSIPARADSSFRFPRWINVFRPGNGNTGKNAS